MLVVLGGTGDLTGRLLPAVARLSRAGRLAPVDVLVVNRHACCFSGLLTTVGVHALIRIHRVLATATRASSGWSRPRRC